MDNHLSRMLLRGELRPHTRLRIDVTDDRLDFRPTDGEVPAAATEAAAGPES